MLIGDKLTRGLSNLDNLIKQLISNNLSSLARDVFPDVAWLQSQRYGEMSCGNEWRIERWGITARKKTCRFIYGHNGHK